MINKRKEEGEPLTVGATENFIVTFQGGSEIYKNYGLYLDSDPVALAQFLETKTSKVLSYLNVKRDDSILHVLEVRPGKGIRGMMFGGFHTFNESSNFGNKKWNRVRFSEVTSGKKSGDHARHLPYIYDSAIHEAIGHSIVQPLIMPQLMSDREAVDNNFVGSLNEGTAVFTQDIALELDSHYRYAYELVNLTGVTSGLDAYWYMYRMEEISSQFDLPKSPQIQERLTEMPIAGISLPINKAFDITWTGEQSRTSAHYPRKASLNKFMFDKLGSDLFQKWTMTGERTNFAMNSSEITGLSSSEIHSEWRKSVLERMQRIVETYKHKIPHFLGGARRAKRVAVLFEEYS